MRGFSNCYPSKFNILSIGSEMVSQTSKQGRRSNANLFNREGTMVIERFIETWQVVFFLGSLALWTSAIIVLIWAVWHTRKEKKE